MHASLHSRKPHHVGGASSVSAAGSDRITRRAHEPDLARPDASRFRAGAPPRQCGFRMLLRRESVNYGSSEHD